MIVYDTKNWWATILKIYLSFNRAYTTRVLFKYILYVTIYTAVIVVVEIELMKGHYSINPLFFSLLGVILSLMLVFRLNSAYDKFWEGRTAWGYLVNNSRTLAAYLNAIIPKEDKKSRDIFATLISNYAIALQGHLREGVNFDEFERSLNDSFEEIQKFKHVPHKIASVIFEEIEKRVRVGVFSEIDKLNVKTQIDTMIDVLGICERIKNTPIPFSHNSYIKTFILVYTLALPFGMVDTLMYYTIPTVALISYALIGVEVISEEIEEPFGKEANDLPLIQLSNIIKQNVFDILEVEYELNLQSKSVEIETVAIQIFH